MRFPAKILVQSGTILTFIISTWHHSYLSFTQSEAGHQSTHLQPARRHKLFLLPTLSLVPLNKLTAILCLLLYSVVKTHCYEYREKPIIGNYNDLIQASWVSRCQQNF